MSRAERRHHLERRKAWARHLIKHVWGYGSTSRGYNNGSPLDDETFIGRMAVTPKACGGSCCKNRRWMEGPSISELRRIDDDYREAA